MPAPLFKKLLEYSRREKASFHTPGHKGGYGLPQKIKSVMEKSIFPMDITVFPAVDSLHHPEKCIMEAQELLAEAYGAKASFFLVNGSSVGNLSALLSQFRPGDSLLVSRIAHCSVIGGIILGQVWPIWMQPPVLDKQNIILECNVQVVEKYLQEFPEVKAVLLTSPTYNGVITDLEKIAEIVHKHGKLLIVDEAWGPHLHFLGRKLSATECGADIVINSLHKILPTFSQGSVIHVMNDDRVDLDRLRRVVSLLQTTSPFYPGLALMDWVREWMVKKGKRLTEKMFELGIHGRERLNRIPHVSAFSPEQLPEGYFFDESKLTLEISEMGYTGYQLDKILSRRGIQVDCAGYTTLIAPLGLGSRKKDIDLLVSELKNIKPKNKKISFYFWLPKFSPEMALLPNDVFFIQNRKKIPIEESVGLISAEIVSPYPPGIPVLVPGERITVEVCNYLKDLVKRKIIKKTGLEVVSL